MTTPHERFEPVPGPLWTRPFMALAALAALALVLIPVRFYIGLGPSTGLNDGYPWGLWKIVNVIILTGVASGGYTVALIVYGLNRHRYHPLARHAIATSAVGYTSGIFALGIVDLGRPWNFVRLLDVRTWNLHSVLLEVGVCMTVYMAFLWMEMGPPLLDSLRARPDGRLKRFAAWATPWLERFYPWIVAAAITLPSMHQSSLGSLFLLTGPRLHELWQTPLLPLFFLGSAWIMGISAVIVAVMLAHLYWKQPLPLKILRRLSRWNAGLVLLFFVLRLADASAREQTDALFHLDKFGLLFGAEMLVALPPALLLVFGDRKEQAGRIFRMALVTLTGGALYRFNVCLGAYRPGDGWHYFPSTMEILMSAGLCALGVVAYLVIVKRLPIIDTTPPGPLARRAQPEARNA